MDEISWGMVFASEKEGKKCVFRRVLARRKMRKNPHALFFLPDPQFSFFFPCTESFLLTVKIQDQGTTHPHKIEPHPPKKVRTDGWHLDTSDT